MSESNPASAPLTHRSTVEAPMPQDMIGKRALVTGAARGIGLAIASRLASGGARVAVIDQDEAGAVDAAAKIGDGAIGSRCDVRSTADVNTAVATAISRLGGLDIRVNNAGIEVASPLLETSASDMMSLFDVNVFGVWRCTRAAVKALTDRRGAIVNIASAVGFGNAPLLGAYSGTEAAVLRLTESLAFELRHSVSA
jgi:NAD(P)-dependent dehydrogenase (short-subunit alcohol dehydrogenase family)